MDGQLYTTLHAWHANQLQLMLKDIDVLGIASTLKDDGRTQ
jgi:hypothetical protein